MKRTIQWVVLLTLAALPLAAQQRQKSSESQPLDAVKSRIELKATADSEVTFADAAIVELEDGTTRIRVRTDLADSASLGFFYTVDTKARTYTAYRSDSVRAQERVPQSILARHAKRLVDIATNRNAPDISTESVYDPPPNCGTPTLPEPCDNVCSGNTNAVLTTYDAAGNWLADTEGNLNYRRGGANGCRWFQFMNGRCTANSNAGGKVWATDSCAIQNYTIYADGIGRGAITGNFSNYNGGNANLVTRIRHYLFIDYFAPNSAIYHEHNITGEFYTSFWYEHYAWQNGYCNPY